MYTSLCFCSRDTLYTVYPRFIFQYSVDVVSGDTANNFFVSSGSSFIRVGYFHFPSFGLTKLGIHTEKVAGKDSGFVSPRTASDFEDCIFAVLWIGRNKHQLDFFFQYRKTFLTIVHLLFSHFTHVGVRLIRQNIFGFFDITQQLNIFFAGFHQVIQILVFFSQFDITFLVGNYCRVGDKGRYFFKTGYKSVQFF